MKPVLDQIIDAAADMEEVEAVEGINKLYLGHRETAGFFLITIKI
jgi:hypothetical protein